MVFDDTARTDLFSEPMHGILKAAFRENATDIHFDPVPNGKLVRFRVDGMVHEKAVLPREEADRLLNQIKLAARLGIERNYESREADIELPEPWEDYNLRVSLVPVGLRESLHMRLMRGSLPFRDFAALGMEEENRNIIRNVLDMHHGLVLLAGRTGSGKTTTMYSMLDSMDLDTNIACSIEDPVEFRMPRVRQVQVDRQHGLDMGQGLNVLLRMDPDVLVVGEIRDSGSAVTSVRAALAGRLVLATIHASTASMAVDALINLSVPRFILGGALRMIVMQELLRRVCRECAREVEPDAEVRELFRRFEMDPPERVLKAAGCMACNYYGYAGRTGIFELLPVDRQVGMMIMDGGDQMQIGDALGRLRRESILRNALSKAARGIISIDEARDFCVSSLRAEKRIQD